MNSAKRKLPEMVVIAEVCCSPQEVRKILMRQAEDLLDSKIYSLAVRDRDWLVKRLTEYCDQHYFSRFQRRKTIMDVAKRTLSRRLWAALRAKC